MTSVITRRAFVGNLTGGLLTASLAPVAAQPAVKVPRIGVLQVGTAAGTPLFDGGNITGHSAMSPELSGKRLELLKELRPGLSRVAILWNPGIRGAVLDYKETESAARSLHLKLQSVELSRIEDLDRSFAAITAERTEALVVPAINPVMFSNRSQIAALAQKHRLPTIFGAKEYADAGGLMAYGPNASDLWRNAASYVDRILKGARPAYLPVEQPTKFELVINLKTAKALGLTIPPSLLARADQVIE